MFNYWSLKRLGDLFLATLMLTLLSPILFFVGFAIWCHLGSPVFFRQLRPGLNARPFNIIKFRTMSSARNAKGVLLSDSQRVTSFGRWLRSTSVDELPELLNVMRGEMSFVGPRPLLMEYLTLYSPDQARRHDVIPGITGWAQINGRNALSWDAKFIYDLWYVENQSFFLDLRILFISVLKVLRRENVNFSSSQSMPPFLGHKQGHD
jgi:lipopolysaccharide/colanic/teichoic acid biosynthesis glycosyltransferase